MSVLVYIESHQGKIKKSGFEAMYYGSQTAKLLQTECIGLTIGTCPDAGHLGQYGASKVINVPHSEDFDSQTYSSIIAQCADKNNSSIVILAHTADGKCLTGRLSVKLNASLISGANGLPDLTGGFTVSKSVFSGKAIAHYNLTATNKVISVMGNSLQPQVVGQPVSVETMNVTTSNPKTKVLARKTADGIVPLPEAELVVSAGRGMKGPENWGIIEDLASVIGATTACSRPVADTDWRPHHEHVGQTGVAIRPNLYIAVGISGAIQHLAGVNNSKTIVVINKDPEAPFFKAADYGVLGDLFEIVPKLTESLKKFKANS